MFMFIRYMQKIVPKYIHEILRIRVLETISLIFSLTVVMSMITLRIKHNTTTTTLTTNTTTTELWPIFCSLILKVFAVTDCSISSNLARKVEHQSIALLYTIYSADSATVALFLYKFSSYRHYICTLLRTVHCSTIYIINTKTHSC